MFLVPSLTFDVKLSFTEHVFFINPVLFNHHQVREMNLLRESNAQLREENKHNFDECQVCSRCTLTIEDVVQAYFINK